MTDTIGTYELRKLIWQESGQNLYTITIGKQRIGWNHDATDHSPYMWYKLLCEVRRMKSTALAKPITTYKLQPVPRPAAVQHDHKTRYNEAHKLNFAREYPAAFRDGHYSAPVMPKVKTANGLTTFIINYLNWCGYRATRINVSGRLIDKTIRTEAGNKMTVKKMIKSATRKGSADISSTILGRSVQWEVKVGRDQPSEAQLLEQRRERRAGGEYYFVHNTDEFFTFFDELVYSQ